MDSAEPPPAGGPSPRWHDRRVLKAVPQMGSAGSPTTAVPLAPPTVKPRSPPLRSRTSPQRAGPDPDVFSLSLTPEPLCAAAGQPVLREFEERPANDPRRNVILLARAEREKWLSGVQQKAERTIGDQSRLRIGPLDSFTTATRAERVRAHGACGLPLYQATGKSRRWPEGSRKREVSIPLPRTMPSAVDRQRVTRRRRTRRVQRTHAAEQCRALFAEDESPPRYRQLRTADSDADFTPDVHGGEPAQPPRTQGPMDKARIAAALNEQRRRLLAERMNGEELLRRESSEARTRRELRLQKAASAFRRCDGLRGGPSFSPGLPGLLHTPAHRPEPAAQHPSSPLSPNLPEGRRKGRSQKKWLNALDSVPSPEPEVPKSRSEPSPADKKQKPSEEELQAAAAAAATSGRWHRSDFDFPQPRSTTEAGPGRAQGMPERGWQAALIPSPKRSPLRSLPNMLRIADAPRAQHGLSVSLPALESEPLPDDLLAAVCAALVVAVRSSVPFLRVPLHRRPCSPTRVNDRKWHVESTILKRLLEHTDLGNAEARRGRGLVALMDDMTIPAQHHHAIQKRAPHAEEGFCVLREAVGEEGSGSVPPQYHAYRDLGDPAAYVTASEAASRMALPPEYRDPTPAESGGAVDPCYGGLFSRKEMFVLAGLLPRRPCSEAGTQEPCPNLLPAELSSTADGTERVGRSWHTSRCPPLRNAAAVPSPCGAALRGR